MGWVLAVLFALGAGLLIIKQLMTRTPSLQEEFVTRREFTALETRIDSSMDEMSTQLTANNKEGEARVIRLYDKIDQTSEKTVDRIIKLISEQNKK